MFEWTSLAHLAVAGLVHTGSAATVATARAVVASFPADDRTALENFLRSGGLTLSAPQRLTV